MRSLHQITRHYEWIRTDLLFGRLAPPIITPQTCQLQVNDPRCVHSFQSFYYELVVSHKIGAKIFRLQQICGCPLTADQEDKYNNIDRTMKEGWTFANANCRRIKMGNRLGQRILH